MSRDQPMKTITHRTTRSRTRLSKRLLPFVPESLSARRAAQLIPLPVARLAALRAGPGGFLDQHHRNVVLDGKDEPALGVFAVKRPAFLAETGRAEAARHDVEQVLGEVHRVRSDATGGSP